MNKLKKGILSTLKNFSSKSIKKYKKLDSIVLNLTLQIIDSDKLKFEGNAVYSTDKKILVYVFNSDADFAIPEGVEIIGRMAFRNKKLLKTITIPSSVKKIEKYAFYGCVNLDNIYIPSTVESVKAYAFGDCESLQSVTFAGLPQQLSRYAFNNCDNIHRITVPSGKGKTYTKTLRIGKKDSNIEFIEKDLAKKSVEKTAKTKEEKNVVAVKSQNIATKKSTETKKAGTAKPASKASDRGAKTSKTVVQKSGAAKTAPKRLLPQEISNAI